MKGRITEGRGERRGGWGWVHWGRLGRADLGRVAGQVRERVKRGLKENEGGAKGEMIKREAQGNASGGEGEGEEDGLGRGLRGGM